MGQRDITLAFEAGEPGVESTGEALVKLAGTLGGQRRPLFDCLVQGARHRVQVAYQPPDDVVGDESVRVVDQVLA